MTTEGVMIWVLGGCCTLLVLASSYLLAREFNRKDRIESEQSSLAEEFRAAASEWQVAAATWRVLVEEVRSWTLKEFVRISEHREDLKGVKDELARCSDRCPYRKETK